MLNIYAAIFYKHTQTRWQPPQQTATAKKKTRDTAISYVGVHTTMLE